MRKYFVILVIVSAHFIASGQDQIVSSLETSSIRVINPLFRTDTLIGYYMYSQLDESNKSDFNYNIIVYDLELSPIVTLNFSHDWRLKLTQLVFNGTAYCAVTTIIPGKQGGYGFNNPPNNLFFFKEGGELIKATHVPASGKNCIWPIFNKGFFIGDCVKKVGGIYSHEYEYYFERFDNKGEVIFTYNSNKQKLVKVLGEYCFLMSEENDKSTKKQICHFSMVDGKAGKILFEYDGLSTPSRYFFPIEISENPLKKDEFLLLSSEHDYYKFGKYFPIDLDNIIEFTVFNFDLNGKFEEVIALPNDFNIGLSKDSVKFGKNYVKMESLMVNKFYYHNMKYHLISHVYRKKNSCELFDFSLDTNFVIQKEYTSTEAQPVNDGSFPTLFGYRYIKDKSIEDGTLIYEPSNTDKLTSFRGMYFCGNSINSLSFIIDESDDSKNSLIQYGTEKKYKNVSIESIFLTDGKPHFAKMKFNFNSDYYQLMPAKPGYICVFEYFEKEKKIDFRLEKFDF